MKTIYLNTHTYIHFEVNILKLIYQRFIINALWVSWTTSCLDNGASLCPL